MFKHSLFTQLLIFLSIITTIFLATPAQAADKVIFKYGFLRESISVAELTTLVQTGEVSSSLRSYLRMADKDPEDLRDLLTQELEVEGVLLYKILRTVPGELMLDQVSEVMHTPSNRANRQSLRSALVKSALDDNQVTLMEIMQNYPTTDLHVEGERLADIYEQVNGIVKNLSRFDLDFLLNLNRPKLPRFLLSNSVLDRQY